NTIKKRPDVTLQSGDNDVVVRQRNYLRRRFVADDIELCIGKTIAYQRINFFHEKENSINIRRMLKSANKKKISTQRERCGRPGNINNVGDDLDGFVWPFFLQ